MARRAKVTITIASDRLEQLDEIALARGSNRSALIDEALDLWEKEQLRRELVAGYEAMAAEDSKTAEHRLRSGIEAID
jgi:metal-responsive CopG/Arc/MetJ family transcriptional regulator